MAIAPSSQAHQRHFFEFAAVEKSASLIVEGLYSAVKNILRRSLTRCKERISGLVLLTLGRARRVERPILKSRIIDTHRTNRGPEIACGACACRQLLAAGADGASQVVRY
jgi:hypothetical protein